MESKNVQEPGKEGNPDNSKEDGQQPVDSGVSVTLEPRVQTDGQVNTNANVQTGSNQADNTEQEIKAPLMLEYAQNNNATPEYIEACKQYDPDDPNPQTAEMYTFQDLEFAQDGRF